MTIEELTQERDALKTERDSLTTERDALKTERDSLTTERDALKTERDSLMTERDALKAERDEIKQAYEEKFGTGDPTPPENELEKEVLQHFEKIF